MAQPNGKKETSNVVRVDFGNARVVEIRNRLRRATAEMAEGIAVQRREMAVFRSAMKDLDAEMQSLRETLTDYDRRLSRIGVVPLRRKSQRLVRIMDDAAASAGAHRR